MSRNEDKINHPDMRDGTRYFELREREIRQKAILDGINNAYNKLENALERHDVAIERFFEQSIFEDQTNKTYHSTSDLRNNTYRNARDLLNGRHGYPREDKRIISSLYRNYIGLKKYLSLLDISLITNVEENIDSLTEVYYEAEALYNNWRLKQVMRIKS